MMDRVKVFIVVAVFVLVGVGAFLLVNNLGGNDPYSSPNELRDAPSVSTGSGNTQAVETESVTIINYAFSPANIKVKKGTTVTWTNQDSIGHDVVPDNPTRDFRQSPMLGRGETYSVTFNETGTFTYYCSPHRYMTGSVEVIE